MTIVLSIVVISVIVLSTIAASTIMLALLIARPSEHFHADSPRGRTTENGGEIHGFNNCRFLHM